MFIKIKKISNTHFGLEFINGGLATETRGLLTKDFLKHDLTHIAMILVLPIKIVSLFEYPDEIERLAGCLHDLSVDENLQLRIEGVKNLFEAYGQEVPFSIDLSAVEKIREEYLFLKSRYHLLKTGEFIDLHLEQ